MRGHHRAGKRVDLRTRSFLYRSLGESIDHRAMIGAIEVRVQKSRRSALFAEGETCYLKFSQLHFYPYE